MTMFEERETRDISSIWANATGLGDDVLMDLADVDDIGIPVLAPNNEILTTESAEIREDLTKAGLQDNFRTIAKIAPKTGLAAFGETKINNMMLFVLLGLSLVGVLLFVSSGRKRTERRF